MHSQPEQQRSGSDEHGNAPTSQPPHTGAAASWTSTGGDLLVSPTDTLPHVDSREVEEIFAGIELEMSSRDGFSLIGPSTPSHGQFIETGGQIAAGRETNPHIAHPTGYQPGQHHPAYQPSGHNQAFNAGASNFDGVSNRPEFPDHSFPGRHNSRTQHGIAPGGFPGPGLQREFGFGHDPSGFPPKGAFDLDDLPKESRRPPSPRADPMKQQQKWEDDEKLGEMATISPVLYANLEHVKLKEEYPGE